MFLKVPLKIISEANSSEHWSKKSKRHKLQRLVLQSYLNQEIYMPKLPCVITLTRYAPRLLDDDNVQMSFKWIRDFLSSVLIPGKPLGHTDNDPRIKWVYAQEKTKDKEYYFTIQATSMHVSESQSLSAAAQPLSSTHYDVQTTHDGRYHCSP